jgi:hypothetical protein
MKRIGYQVALSYVALRTALGLPITEPKFN